MWYNVIVLEGVIEISQDDRDITTHKISSLRVAIRFDYGFVAQLVEHRTFNARVAGPYPARPNNKKFQNPPCVGNENVV